MIRRRRGPPWRQRPPGLPAVGVGPASPSLSDQLSEITRLHDQGILADEEFSAAKAKLLGI